MPSRTALANLAFLILIAGCAGGMQDPYSGYYLGADKTVRITPSGSGKYHVVLRGKSGLRASMDAESSEGQLKSDYSGGYVIAFEGGSTYSMGGPGQREEIRKTDSAGFAEWWKAAGDSSDAPGEDPAPL
ncbi:MAG: hypothetical protein JWP91_2815 [Fibrobacteres bacterium]|nr:hypothetical protein [Fibrobacterota bacterium]